MLRLVSILLVGIGVFVGASSWQVSQRDSNFRHVPNFLGQICDYGNCFRPELLAGGLVIVLIGIWIFMSNRQPLDIGGDTTKVIGYARQNRMTLLIAAVAGIALLSLGGFIKMGAMAATASYAWCSVSDVGRPVRITLRNETLSIVRNTTVRVAIRERDGVVHSQEVTIDSLLLPFQQQSWCARTDYTDVVVKPYDGDPSSQLDRWLALADRSEVTAMVLSYGLF